MKTFLFICRFFKSSDAMNYRAVNEQLEFSIKHKESLIKDTKITYITRAFYCIEKMKIKVDMSRVKFFDHLYDQKMEVLSKYSNDLMINLKEWEEIQIKSAQIDKELEEFYKDTKEERLHIIARIFDCERLIGKDKQELKDNIYYYNDTFDMLYGATFTILSKYDEYLVREVQTIANEIQSKLPELI